MKIRAIVFEDDEEIRTILEEVLAERGYEVIAFSDPGTCPLHVQPSCKCPPDGLCADIIISDLNMPNVRGLDFLEAQRRKGCKIQHVALISGGWTGAEMRRADETGCRVFAKPLEIQQIHEWLDQVEGKIDARRTLVDWPP